MEPCHRLKYRRKNAAPSELHDPRVASIQERVDGVLKGHGLNELLTEVVCIDGVDASPSKARVERQTQGSRTQTAGGLSESIGCRRHERTVGRTSDSETLKGDTSGLQPVLQSLHSRQTSG